MIFARDIVSRRGRAVGRSVAGKHGWYSRWPGGEPRWSRSRDHRSASKAPTFARRTARAGSRSTSVQPRPAAPTSPSGMLKPESLSAVGIRFAAWVSRIDGAAGVRPAQLSSSAFIDQERLKGTVRRTGLGERLPACRSVKCAAASMRASECQPLAKAGGSSVERRRSTYPSLDLQQRLRLARVPTVVVSAKARRNCQPQGIRKKYR